MVDCVSLAYNGAGSSSVADPLLTTRTYSFKTVYSMRGTRSINLALDAALRSRLDTMPALLDYQLQRLHHSVHPQRQRQDFTHGSLERTDGPHHQRAVASDIRLPARLSQAYRHNSLRRARQSRQQGIRATTDAGACSAHLQVRRARATTRLEHCPRLAVRRWWTARTDVNDTTTYEWDNAGNLSSVTMPGARYTLSKYDAHGRPRLITDLTDW